MGAARRRGRRRRDPPYLDRPRRNARRVRSRADRAGRRCRPRPRDRVGWRWKRKRFRGAVHDDRKRRRAGRLDLSLRRGRRLRPQTRTRRPWRPRASERRGGVIDSMSFDERGLVPAIVQDAGTGAVLMLAYMDREAVEATLPSREAHFHSRSRGRLWKKGDTSGNVLHLVDLRLDCDGDALLVEVHPAGPACHTGSATCFGPTNDLALARFLSELAALLRERRRDLPEGTFSRVPRSIQIARIPAACAPATSRARLSPIMTACCGLRSSAASAVSKICASGFPTPSSAEMIVTSNDGANAVCESFSFWTSGAPLVTSASRWSSARSRTTVSASGSTS